MKNRYTKIVVSFLSSNRWLLVKQKKTTNKTKILASYISSLTYLGQRTQPTKGTETKVEW